MGFLYFHFSFMIISKSWKEKSSDDFSFKYFELLVLCTFVAVLYTVQFSLKI